MIAPAFCLISQQNCFAEEAVKFALVDALALDVGDSLALCFRIEVRNRGESLVELQTFPLLALFDNFLLTKELAGQAWLAKDGRPYASVHTHTPFTCYNLPLGGRKFCPLCPSCP